MVGEIQPISCILPDNTTYKLYNDTVKNRLILNLQEKVLKEESKDFYDLYFLSHTFQRLSVFIDEYGDPAIKEALVNWFRTYNRIDIKTGILELVSRKEIDYQVMERHFKREIDAMIKKELR